MNDTETNPQSPPEGEEPTSGTGGTPQDESTEGLADSDPPIIVHGTEEEEQP
jgi:hypothetical protein